MNIIDNINKDYIKSRLMLLKGLIFIFLIGFSTILSTYAQENFLRKDEKKALEIKEEVFDSICSADPIILDRKDFYLLVREVSFGVVNYLHFNSLTSLSYTFVPAFSLIRFPPVNFYINVLASRYLSLSFSIEIPNWGIGIPLFITGEETLEVRLQFRNFYIGLGLLFTQINLNFSNIFIGGTTSDNFIHNTEYPLLEDVKIGINFAYYSQYGNIHFTYYSRWLFPDYRLAARGVRLDRNFIRFYYEYRFSEYGASGLAKFLGSARFFTEIVIKEIFITEYQVGELKFNIEHYLGVYDFRLLGFEYGLSLAEGGKDRFSIGFSYTFRLYLRNYANERLRTFGSGNSFFGLNIGNFASDLAPGLRSLAHIGTVFSKQNIIKGFILSEAIGFEFVNKNIELGHNLFFELKASYLFSYGL